MNRDSQASAHIPVARLLLVAMTCLSLVLIAPEILAQSTSPPSVAPGAQTGGSPQPAAQQPSTTDADLAQMRTDLNQMESLLGNMSSEIEFLRDQNLQILLRTNARMWTMLIRDLRRQIDREEQQRTRR